jgi:dTDP-4-dehydrorhamnose 3,5-epimerase
MEKIPLKLQGAILLTPTVHHDLRGYFCETYNQEELRQLGINHKVVQVNRSLSRRGVLRGLHYQLLKPQGKMISVLKGKILDVSVDIRPDSPTFKQYLSVELDSERGQILYVPPGYAHGFTVLADEAIVQYTCDNLYSGPEDQHGIRWNDPDLKIEWLIRKKQGPRYPIISEKDAALPMIRSISPDLLPRLKALHV